MPNEFTHPTWPEPFEMFASQYACPDTYVDASPIARADSAYQMVGQTGPSPGDMQPVLTWWELVAAGVAIGVGIMWLRGRR